MSKPFFSIAIPTYNRANYLKRALTCILCQNFEDFEIIIFDNNSKDNTQAIVKKFKDKRILYIKNKRNIGAIANIKKIIRYAKGEYVILHGDDDFIIDNKMLAQAYNLLKKRPFGFVRLNYLHLSYNMDRIFDIKKIDDDIEIKPKRQGNEILSFLIKSDFSFISGIIFRNYKNAYKDIIRSETGPWFRIVFKNIYMYGGYIFAKHFLIAKWSRGFPSLYLLEKGELKFENYYREVEKVVDKKYYNEFLKDDLKYRIILIPGAKLYTGTKNAIRYAKRIVELLPEYKYSYFFWLYFLATLFTPSFIFRLIRKYKEEGLRKYKIPHEKALLLYVKQITNNN